MRGPQHNPQYTIFLIVGTPKRVPLILGNPYVSAGLTRLCRSAFLASRNFGFRVEGLGVLRITLAAVAKNQKSHVPAPVSL